MLSFGGVSFGKVQRIKPLPRCRNQPSQIEHLENGKKHLVHGTYQSITSWWLNHPFEKYARQIGNDQPSHNTMDPQLASDFEDSGVP